MKQIFRINILLILLTTFLFSACTEKNSSELELKDDSRIVVKINGRALTKAEMHRELLNLISTLGSGQSVEGLMERRSEFELQAIQNLINSELLVTEAKNRGIHVVEEDIQNQIVTLQAAYANGVLLQKEMQIRDLSPDELYSEAERALLVEKIVTQITDSVPIPDDNAVETYFDENKERLSIPAQVHASHILIRVEKDDTESVKVAKREELVRIREKIVAGASFEEQARLHSQCPSAPRGGDLGWFSKGKMEPKMTNLALKMEPGELSDIIETEFGFHIMTLHEKREPRSATLSEIGTDLRNYLHDQSKRAAIQSFIEALREKADIEIVPQD